MTLIHSSEASRGPEFSVHDIYKSHVQVKTHYEVKEVHGSERLESIAVFHTKNNTEKIRQVERIRGHSVINQVW